MDGWNEKYNQFIYEPLCEKTCLGYETRLDSTKPAHGTYSY